MRVAKGWLHVHNFGIGLCANCVSISEKQYTHTQIVQLRIDNYIDAQTTTLITITHKEKVIYILGYRRVHNKYFSNER